MKNVVLIALVVLVILFVVYQYDSTLFGLLKSREGFEDAIVAAGGAVPSANSSDAVPPGKNASPGNQTRKLVQSNEHVNAVASGDPQSSGAYGNEGFKAEAPAGCYPRDQLTPSELLPKDMNSNWAEQNPMGPGSLKGKNFLSAGALIGVNTVGQSLRNANLQVRSEPPNPQVPVSIFNQTTISPDISHRPLEIGA